MFPKIKLCCVEAKLCDRRMIATSQPAGGASTSIVYLRTRTICSKSTPFSQQCGIAFIKTLKANDILPFRFSQAEVQTANVVKSSAQRAVRQELLEQLKINAETLEQIWPKKEPLTQVKWSVQLLIDADLLEVDRMSYAVETA